MKKYYCNPLNINYRYQFVPEKDGGIARFREAADPSLVYFKGKYLMFPSMSLGFYYSDDLAEWNFYPLQTDMPLYDYAPDVRAVGDYLYFCASHRDTPCDFYRTSDPFGGRFEKIEGTFDFWDPNLFEDKDGKIYLYHGCSNYKPIWGVELDKNTMRPAGEPVGLIYGNAAQNGFERMGWDHKSGDNGVLKMLQKQLSQQSGLPEDKVTAQMIIDFMPPQYKAQVKASIENAPYIEGAWMTERGGRYYLQYAVPDTQVNVYSDGVYVSKSPLGPFVLAENNPFSYRPSGFATGAGHGSTMEDKFGNRYHAATVTVSKSHSFERRLGLWKCGFDSDGELFCNQRFADWVTEIPQENSSDIWKEPDWMLLSYKKDVKASGAAYLAGNVVDEDIRTWWRAATEYAGEWVEVDLGRVCSVHAVQVNFADEAKVQSLPEGAEYRTVNHEQRYIDPAVQFTRWILEGSEDGEKYFIIEDKRGAQTDLPHDLVVRPEGMRARYIRLTVEQVPYGQNACVSGLRVFGKADVKLPAKPVISRLSRTSDLDFKAEWKGDAVGYNVLWGSSPDKLYHCKQVLGATKTEVGALVKGREYFVRIDAFNEGGITHGDVVKLCAATKI